MSNIKNPAGVFVREVLLKNGWKRQGRRLFVKGSAAVVTDYHKAETFLYVDEDKPEGAVFSYREVLLDYARAGKLETPLRQRPYKAGPQSRRKQRKQRRDARPQWKKDLVSTFRAASPKRRGGKGHD